MPTFGLLSSVQDKPYEKTNRSRPLSGPHNSRVRATSSTRLRLSRTGNPAGAWILEPVSRHDSPLSVLRNRATDLLQFRDPAGRRHFYAGSESIGSRRHYAWHARPWPPPLSRLDRATTERLNQEKNLELHLPAPGSGPSAA